MTIYHLTPAARADLADIWDYTEERWGVVQAERYMRQIEQVFQALIDGICISYDAEEIRAGYRRAIVGRHMIYYRKKDERIMIVRILHQSMDVDGQLG
jgi:toxin ParE1/3/4